MLQLFKSGVQIKTGSFVMPFTFYLSSENQLSIQDVEVLQNAARANDTGNIIIGDRQLSVRYHAGSGGTPLRQRSSVVSSGVADG